MSRASRKFSTTASGSVVSGCCASAANALVATPAGEQYARGERRRRGNHATRHAPGPPQFMGRGGGEPGRHRSPSRSASRGSRGTDVKLATLPRCTQMELVTRSPLTPSDVQSSPYTSASHSAPCSLGR